MAMAAGIVHDINGPKILPDAERRRGRSETVTSGTACYAVHNIALHVDDLHCQSMKSILINCPEKATPPT